MTAVKSNRTFSLGQLAMTRGVYEAIPFDEVMEAVERHASCDWGDVCKEDWELNDASLEDDSRILSEYRSSERIRFWIITEWDRALTTVLLPEEY